MSVVGLNKVIAALIAGSMLAGSTSAIAAAPAPAVSQQVSPWVALTALTAGAPATTLCGAAAAAAAAGQAPTAGCVLPAVDAPPPMAEAVQTPAPLAAEPIYAFQPLYLALASLAVGGLIYALTRNDHHHHISPA